MHKNDTCPDSSTDLVMTAEPLGLVWIHPEAKFTSLCPPQVTFGRGDEVDVMLAGGRVSRVHARIVRTGPLTVVTDAGSTNGVFHNGARVQEAPLADNDVLRMGDHLAIVVRVPSDFSGEQPLFHEPLPGTLVGLRSRPLWGKLARLATSNVPVVLEGPTGTGKEVYAKALHQLSGREGDFVGLNCAAVPEGLAESQLFGMVRGSYTGAMKSAAGLFEAAHRGTLLLDEIVDLSPQLQAKLLRVIEESAVLRVGETSPRSVDFRLVAACQKPLLKLVDAGLFRSDLLARLAGGTLRLPPLKERREEILPLFKKFFSRAGGDETMLSASFCEAVCLCDWPLNTRQLVQLATHGALTTPSGTTLRRADLDLLVKHVYGDAELATKQSLPPPDDKSQMAARLGVRRAMWFERHRDELDALLVEMKSNGGNISRAARAIGMSRQRASRLLSARSTLGRTTSVLRAGHE